jgi:NAD+ diphosphatase
VAHFSDFSFSSFGGSPFPEPSARVGFAQNTIIRDAENRDEESLGKALSNPAVRYYVFSSGKVLVRKGDDPTALFDKEEAETFDVKPERAVLLGEAPAEGGQSGGPRIAIPGRIDEETLVEPYKLYDYRSLLYSSSVNETDVGAIAQGGSLLYWHAVNKFCGKCGTASVSHIGGYRRDCPACDHKIFPRTDPVVIMLAVQDGKCLMGRSPHFPEGWYSTLAGFVEPGETIEDAVRRETFEESGIKIRRVHYHASQPWPFPHSLMIGVHCEAVSDDISFQENELEDCRWFTREDVKLMIADEHPMGFKCPPSKAIASALIQAWVES